MDKQSLSEADICLKFITPALVASGWDVNDQVFQEVTLKAGRVVVRGHHAARDKKTIRRADYMLCRRPGVPIAVIEAKDNNHALGAGMGHAIEYAGLLDVPFAISSNGDGFLLRDRTLADGVLERELPLDAFPSRTRPAIRCSTEFAAGPRNLPWATCCGRLLMCRSNVCTRWWPRLPG